MASVWLEEQTKSLMIQNQLKTMSIKRKRIDDDDLSNKRKTTNNPTTKCDNDDEDRLSLSPRVAPIISKVLKSSNIVNRSLLPMALFKCQLCHQNLRNKDSYLEHMIICAGRSQASIKIMRAEKAETGISLL